MATIKEETVMLQIQDTLVSLALAEEFFCCDLDACKGQCCIEGDAGAPVTEDECDKIREVLPAAIPHMLPRAVEEVERSGVSYIDEEGDLVTTLLDGRNCAFTCYRRSVPVRPGGRLQTRRNRMAQAVVVRAVSSASHGVSLVHRRQLSPLGHLQKRKSQRTARRHTPV